MSRFPLQIFNKIAQNLNGQSEYTFYVNISIRISFLSQATTFLS